MTVIAINVLLDPDAAMVDKAQATNARLREDFPHGFALDANHAPHITILQRFVRTADLDKVANAVGEVLRKEQSMKGETTAISAIARMPMTRMSRMMMNSSRQAVPISSPKNRNYLST